MNQGKPVTTSRDWQQKMTITIGQRVRELRGSHTASWLSERTAELGLRVSRSALSELENGKRKSITLGEFLILAAALDVPPVLLFLPGYPDDYVDLLPHLQADSHDAADWISGEKLLVVTPSGSSLQPFPHRAIALVREREGLLSDALKLFQAGGGEPTELIDAASARKAAINRELDEMGFTVDPTLLDNGEG